MSRQQQADEKEKSIADFVGIVLIVAVLMALFIWYFLKHEQGYQQVALNNAKTRFSSQVLLAHAQWLVEFSPTTLVMTLELPDGSRSKRRITMNKLGWPDSNSASLACHEIWQQVMAEPLKVLNTQVSVVELKRQLDSGKSTGKICRYFLSESRFFEYNSGNGQVTTAN